jgi:hypothetical protein
MRHYHIRYGQWVPDEPDALHAMGVRVIILHQSNGLNPYINYPFSPTIEPKVCASEAAVVVVCASEAAVWW